MFQTVSHLDLFKQTSAEKHLMIGHYTIVTATKLQHIQG